MLNRYSIFAALTVAACSYFPAAYAAQTAPPESPAAASLNQAWTQVKYSYESSDLQALADAVDLLKSRMTKSGYNSMETHSLELLRVAQAKLEQENRTMAQYLTRQALELSPESAHVAFKSLWLAHRTGVKPLVKGALDAAMLVGNDRVQFLALLRGAIYPALLALTCSLIITFCFSFAANIHLMLAGALKLLPAACRGFLAPILLTAAFVCPLLFGPLWTVAAWTVILYIALPDKRWLGFMAGFVVALTACLIPFRESLDRWLASGGIQTMLRISSGVFSPSDRGDLTKVLISRPQDAALWYSLGQVLRREGALSEAEDALKKSSVYSAHIEPRLFAERAAVKFLQGEFEQADELYNQAESKGLRSAEIYFNISKVKFELMDIKASRDFYAKALSMDPKLTERLKAKEDILPLNVPLTIADIKLSYIDLWRSFMQPLQIHYETYLRKSHALMPGLNPFGIGLAGLGMIILFFVVGEKRGRRRVPFYSGYKLAWPLQLLMQVTPGGAWVLKGRPVACFVLLSVCVFMAMPLIGWPFESAAVLTAVPNMKLYYLAFLGALWMAISYIGNQILE
ncbi:MAG: hypothetical protein DCC75_08815 [Proteobacteria bacterium]|nr:MAG: hypothetical protein DCC75_08815 [Pseudomonadota bacterium]